MSIEVCMCVWETILIASIHLMQQLWNLKQLFTFMKKDGFDANVTFGKYKLHTIKIAMLYILFQLLSLKVLFNWKLTLFVLGSQTKVSFLGKSFGKSWIIFIGRLKLAHIRKYVAFYLLVVYFLKTPLPPWNIHKLPTHLTSIIET